MYITVCTFNWKHIHIHYSTINIIYYKWKNCQYIYNTINYVCSLHLPIDEGN